MMRNCSPSLGMKSACPLLRRLLFSRMSYISRAQSSAILTVLPAESISSFMKSRGLRGFTLFAGLNASGSVVVRVLVVFTASSTPFSSLWSVDMLCFASFFATYCFVESGMPNDDMLTFNMRYVVSGSSETSILRRYFSAYLAYSPGVYVFFSANMEKRSAVFGRK